MKSSWTWFFLSQANAQGWQNVEYVNSSGKWLHAHFIFNSNLHFQVLVPCFLVPNQKQSELRLKSCTPTTICSSLWGSYPVWIYIYFLKPPFHPFKNRKHFRTDGSKHRQTPMAFPNMIAPNSPPQMVGALVIFFVKVSHFNGLVYGKIYWKIYRKPEIYHDLSIFPMEILAVSGVIFPWNHSIEPFWR